MELFQSPKKYFLRQNNSKWRVGLCALIGWIYKSERFVGFYDIESIFGGALEQLHGSFSDIGAHQDFQ